LAETFVALRDADAEFRRRGKLIVVGGGPLTEDLRAFLSDHHALQDSWLPGSRDDVANILRSMDVFVLPSLAEGISNAILEAMACGLPVIAGNVGGNRELVTDGVTGQILDAQTVANYSKALLMYFLDNDMLANHRQASRQAALRDFSIQTMVTNYQETYERCLR
jgi:glycosyltransferase involved in cell wall biosynthesis